MTEIERKNFLEGLSAAAETLETDLTVEHLLPTLVSIIEQTAAHDEEKLQHYYKLIFGQLNFLVEFLA